MPRILTVLGATGNIGAALSDRLLEGGFKVRVFGRRPERLRPFADRGAAPHAGSLDDLTAVSHALEGADAAFLMIPPDPTAKDPRASQDRVGETIARAARETGLRRAVNLSSIGAELEEGTGPIAGLHAQEKRLDAVDGLAVVHLRAGWFMENHLQAIEAIARHGVLPGGLSPDLPVPMIATRDIAAAAAELLAEPSAPRGVRYLLGPRDVTMAEAARVLGAAVGRRELAYVQAAPEPFRKALTDAGLSPGAAASYVELAAALNEGRVRAPSRGPASSTPTTLERFAKDFARLFERSAAKAAS